MQKNIRNFAIIAHVDHGKSTLADRFIELTGALSSRELREQVLDTMDIERERGITIKAQTARLKYRSRSGQEYILNMIDTPGHVDFSYEVSRSLAACEGAVLVIDVSQGVEAQTLANAYLAIQHDLVIIPVMNKIDLPQIDLDLALEQLEHIVGLKKEEALLVSAKKGIGIEEVLEAIVERIPPPKGEVEAPLKALLFDSWFDPYRGVIVLVRIVDGTLRVGDRIRLMSNGAEYLAEEIGYLTPKPVKVEALETGEVGYLIAGIKNLSHARIGETITLANRPTAEALPGFKEAKPMVFCGLYPAGDTNIDELRDALEKLKLTDASLHFEPEHSPALGFGFRAGFLGLLHREIVQERLEREFNLNLITTAPSVSYRVVKTDGEVLEIHNPSELPEPQFIEHIEEPIIEALILTPDRYLGPLLQLLDDRRGQQKKMEYISTNRVVLDYLIPLNEVVFDFYSQLKSLSQGYASMDYELVGYREEPLVKLDILVNYEEIDALSVIVHKDKAYYVGRALVDKLRRTIPRQQFEVIIQAAVGKRVIARETIKPFRKDVLAKLYGGDYTRKMKLLEKQKEGKKRMKRVGRVDIPQEAFLAILEVK
ncbi:MAG TPA: translation elongation factor 4 [Candidatus Saccharicenans sp.]|jgi:GTP-binding protein LepA|nr:translation elongation factor 4 [Candidatus Saccharicenans sp.]HOL46225.1 translation elongation factor 4 [Candidatus Saccharicenans sp.]HOT69174.1 translation elongation factor 4 [Candidatus Saccharicenans sp.]HPC88585.1 translation elongation factor 4 [Candidatus Saccharicenans sp.]HPP24582.1 translation elongation factor 4 [Candidatus Saccharicenans sp.]